MNNKILMVFALAVMTSFSCKKDKSVPDINKGLISYFNFDDNSLSDQRSYTESVQKFGNPVLVSGVIGNAITFNGIDQYLQYAPKSPKASSTITISFWAKLTSNIPPNLAMYIGNTSDNYKDVNACVIGPTSFQFIVNTDDSGQNWAQLLQNTNAYSWRYFTGTYDGKYIKLYLDGNLVSTTAFTAKIRGFYSNLIIGKMDNGVAGISYWNGSIDELRIYNRALSKEEVSMLYNLK